MSEFQSSENISTGVIDDQLEQQQQQQQQLGSENFDPNHVIEISQLESLGIAGADLKKLKLAGFHTVSSLLMATTTHLTSIKGLSEAKVEKIQEAVKRLNISSFITAKQSLEQRKNIVYLTTGARALDELLRGGIESGSITEVFGEFRTGKSQLCHTLCVTGQLPISNGGGNGKVLFIDTEGTFRPERVIEIAQRFGVDPDAVLENICVARAYTHEHQMDLIQGVSERMVEDHYSVLIVDSATALFRVDFSGRGQLADRQQKLALFLSRLGKLAAEFNIAVFITNQVVADPGAMSAFVADAKKPIGGNIMAHASTTRLMLRKGKGTQRIMKIFDSPQLPENEAIFSLEIGGVSDAVGGVITGGE
jgi:meiotic recombination protein DMC1